eukprot:9062652-Ditylum_brightwellii.AAC.1
MQEGFKTYKDVRRHMMHGMDLWEKKEFAALVEDTIATNRRQQPTVQRKETHEHVGCIYTWMLLQGKVRQAVYWTTGLEKGGLSQLSDRCSKMGKLISK